MADRVAGPGRLRVPRIDPAPELVGRHLEVVQLYADTKATSHGSNLVPFDPRPQPKIEDHAQTQAQDLLSELPELVFHLLAGSTHPTVSSRWPTATHLSSDAPRVAPARAAVRVWSCPRRANHR